mmetsp:Transcript_34710/g.50858  ORF Transcript_34710/g.50858 Transcript_34710/m.50858 type:complete len:81 (+) Transcript_34710:150-392(+)
MFSQDKNRTAGKTKDDWSHTDDSTDSSFIDTNDDDDGTTDQTPNDVAYLLERTKCKALYGEVMSTKTTYIASSFTYFVSQ